MFELQNNQLSKLKSYLNVLNTLSEMYWNHLLIIYIPGLEIYILFSQCMHTIISNNFRMLFDLI